MMGFDLLLIVGVIAYVLGWRPQLNRAGRGPASESPSEIAKARYARGDITREEYEVLKQDLG
ncbi:MAG: SHOCT domain-containing protein [Bacteroidota bacterium]